MIYLYVEKDPKNRIIKFPNAGSAASWPRASSNMACIFEAIQIVGVARYGSMWDGSEFNCVNWPESPEDESVRKTGDLRKAATKSRPPGTSDDDFEQRRVSVDTERRRT